MDQCVPDWGRWIERIVEAKEEDLGEVVREIHRVPGTEKGEDVLGRVFERLTPETQRHPLGQHFTRPDVVDLILRFCRAYEPDARVLDPACGTGVFLIRAYAQKRRATPSWAPGRILETLWGCEMAQVPARLAMVNLALRGESDGPLHILQTDFFDLSPASLPLGLSPGEQGSRGAGENAACLPRFDAIVGNPPYVRQEEMEGVVGDGSGYKARLIRRALADDEGMDRRALLSGRSGIHAYFFVHGAKFLRQGGRFGFIVNESWLDVDYGKGLQAFFLDHFKILAVIGSKVERWFADADIHTCIVILEKASGEAFRAERDAHRVRFVQLLKPLATLIPPDGSWEAVDRLIGRMLEPEAFSRDETLQIYLRSQRALREEGVGIYGGGKWGRYLRAPEIFFRVLEKDKALKVQGLPSPSTAPRGVEGDIGPFVPLREIAEVQRGFTTGANAFFYLTPEDIQRWGIERRFWMHRVEEDDLAVWKERAWWGTMERDLWRDRDGAVWVPNVLVRSPRECTGPLVDPSRLRIRVLRIHAPREELAGPHVLWYIADGERRGFHRRPTCAARARSAEEWRSRSPDERPEEPRFWGWYDLGAQTAADLLWFKAFNDRVVAPINPFGAYSSDRFYMIRRREGIRCSVEVLGAVLNSTLAHLFVELWGRVNLGEGALDNMVYEAASLPVVDVRNLSEDRCRMLSDAFQALSKRAVRSVFEELGADRPEEVALEKVKPDRREVDRIVMEEVLGLTEAEQLEVYRAVVDLVRSRLEKAGHFVGKRRREGL